MTSTQLMAPARRTAGRSLPPVPAGQRSAGGPVIATELPVARVVVDVPLPHLDHTFDYAVPASMSAGVRPGCRVKVPFSGRDVTAYVLERDEHSGHPGRLAAIRRLVSPEVVLTAPIARLCRDVADHYAGTVADVIRLAVPPRHARVEAELGVAPQDRIGVPGDVLGAPWQAQTGGSALIDRLAAGGHPRGVWSERPDGDWAAKIAAAAAATLRSGRGTIVCVPDRRDVRRIDEAMTRLLGSASHVVLTADLGPAARYRAFLAVTRGQVQIVIGTRSAAFSPVRDLGLVAIWDDGDDLYAEQHAPYPHAREVLALRARNEGAGALIGATSRSIEAQLLVESGWAVAIDLPRSVARAAAPVIHVAGDDGREPANGVRMPRRVFEVVRDALGSGPVLVQVPRAGYLPGLTCGRCRQQAQCMRCSGPLVRRSSDDALRCTWCERAAVRWRCRACRSDTLRAPVVGALRTADEWGRAFPQTTIVRSGGDKVVDALAPTRTMTLVIATPGAEPRVEGGYAAGVLLDTWLQLGRPDLNASAESLRRWMNASALVRSSSDGGRVVAVGESTNDVLQALVRWDPAGFAARELRHRRSARLPPVARLATIEGPRAEVESALSALALPESGDLIGPIRLDDESARAVVRADREHGRDLTAGLHRMQASRSVRKDPALRVQIDPVDLA